MLHPGVSIFLARELLPKSMTRPAAHFRALEISLERGHLVTLRLLLRGQRLEEATVNGFGPLKAFELIYRIRWT